MSLQILRMGSEGEDVRRWQHFLLGVGLLNGGVDGVFGPMTAAATRAFQKQEKAEADGVVGPQTYAAALRRGFDPGFIDPQGGTSGPDWPPPPVFAPLISNVERGAIFGEFRYERISPLKDEIRILGDWEAKHIVSVAIPQLKTVEGAPKSGRVRVHEMVTEQFRALFAAWEDAGLIDLVETWAGSFVPRFVRGSSKTLSNHAWGTAFDINVAWNPRGAVPALRGRPGSVRELVPLANEFGFYWGGHFGRRDGMHFEVARVLN
jgi:peptidoglycan hydrolase-like protein with peptidoglycan-binding domain